MCVYVCEVEPLNWGHSFCTRNVVFLEWSPTWSVKIGIVKWA